MLQAARANSLQCEANLRELLERSDLLLKPLKDPLRADVGIHRWLSQDREEAYSDWLAWVLQELNKVGADLLKLLGISTGPVVDAREVSIAREYFIPQGRLDLLIRFGKQALLIIEVKVTSADTADIAKQKGYCEWFDEQVRLHHLCRLPPVLLAIDASEADYEGFVPLLWEDFCVGVRRLLPRIQDQVGIVNAAMIVAFVGAVEQNLLHLVPPGSKGIGQSLFYARTADHIKRYLKPRATPHRPTLYSLKAEDHIRKPSLLSASFGGWSKPAAEVSCRATLRNWPMLCRWSLPGYIS
jgi:hypothetical protein